MYEMKVSRALVLLALCLAASSSALGYGLERLAIADKPWHYSAHQSTYQRTGPGSEAVFYRLMPPPSLGAAMSFNEDRMLALEMRLLLSTDSQASLERHGPWLNDQGLSNNGHLLIHQIEESPTHGLTSERYGLQKLLNLRELMNRMSLNPNIREATLGSTRRVLSSILDRAFVDLASDLGRGAIEARQVQSRLFRNPPTVDAQALLEKLSTGQTDAGSALRTLIPANSDYQSLIRHMSQLLQQRAIATPRIKVPAGNSLKAGQRTQAVFKAKQRLIQIGDLPVDTVITPMFDAYFNVALQGFQSRHGLEPSGELDQRSRDALNMSLEEEIERVAMSLERLRWMPRERGERHVIVNLPSYRLQLMNKDQPIIDMPVVIGSRKHPTPAFSQQLSYIEFNPTWTVPRSIAEAELLPKELESPGYLQERNFDFFEDVDGRLTRVPYDSVSLEKLEERPFPYFLRQRGGPRNALGRMKFMMPNPYSIYLHDTPAQRHFELTDRAYSHGCIRLSDPDQLARTILGLDAVSGSEISRIFRSTKTQRTRLQQTVPTHLTYLTSWIGEDGRLHHAPDIYRHDPRLMEAMKALQNQSNKAIPKKAHPKDSNTVAQLDTTRSERPVDYDLADAEGP